MTAIAGYNGDIYITAPTSTGFTNEAMTDSGDHTTYGITNTAKRYWDRTVSYTVQTSPDGTTWTTQGATTYTLQYVGGKVIWNTAKSAGTQVRVTGSYFTFSELGQCGEWDVTFQTNLADVTAFGDRWKDQLSTINDATVTVNRWWLDSYFLTNVGGLVIVILYVNTTTNSRYEAYAYLQHDAIKAAATATIDESLTFNVDGQLYFQIS